jgi:hypothetical protein
LSLYLEAKESLFFFQSNRKASMEFSKNPFLDPYSVPPSGKLANENERLFRVRVPEIQTLIYESTDRPLLLSSVPVSSNLNTRNAIASEPAATDAGNVGIGLDISLLTMGAQPTSPIPKESSSIRSGQTMGRQIPTNMHEARNMLHLISPLRTGKKNEAFNIGELKQVARNLNIPTSGKKEELANRIRSSIVEFFNLPNE